MKKAYVLFGLLACSTTLAKPVQQVEQALDLVMASVQTHQLLPMPLECVSLIAEETDAASPDYHIGVYEKHNEKCGGDPATAPKLMQFQINKLSGELCTDSVEWAKKQKASNPYEPECRAIP